MPIHGSGVALLIDRLSDLNFYDEFNRTAEDTDVWTSGGDGGSFTRQIIAGLPTVWQIGTGAVIDNDWYIHSDTVTKNKMFSLLEQGYSTIIWETRLSLPNIADISALWGLFNIVPTDYAEPASPCAHFFADPAITNTFRARSLQAAEEETDTLVALDTDFHKFRMVMTTAKILFYIDDVLVATHAVQIPLRNLFIDFLVRTEAAVAKTMRMDYVRVEVT